MFKKGAIMKSLHSIPMITIVLLSTLLFAQPADSLWVEIDEDTMITIHHDHTYRNCGSLFDMQVEIVGDQITITEVDIGQPAFCECYFDLSVTFGPLAPGQYTADVFGTDTQYGDYWGSLPINIDQNMLLTHTTSGCLFDVDRDRPQLSVEVLGNSIRVLFNHEELNCCLVPQWNGWLDGDVFHAEMVDIGDECDCMCPFNLSADFGPFDPGTYTLDFWNGDFGSPEFTIEADMLLSQTNSDCLTGSREDRPQLTVDVLGDLIQINFNHEELNCCLVPQWTGWVEGSVFHADMEDVGDPCFCLCPFELSALFGPFQPGTYTLDFWDGAYGFPEFTIEDDLFLSQTNSDCLDTFRDERPQLTVEVEGDSIQVNFNHEELNCCLEPVWSGWLEGDVFHADMEDVGLPCDCLCPFELTARFGPFPEGTYTLDFWNGAFGSPQFTIGGQLPPWIISDQYQSPCYEPSEVEGCTDPAAYNYNPDATLDDGSCLYFGEGECTTSDDCNAGWLCIPAPLHCDTEDLPGFCFDIEEPLGCWMNWDPVCGCDGVTYSNTCHAVVFGNTSYSHYGTCEDEPIVDWHVFEMGSDDWPGTQEQPFATISHAIDIATDGEVIMVWPGTYTENLNYQGKDLFITSHFAWSNDLDEIANTILDGGGSGAVVTINSGESEATILQGFTVRNGSIAFEQNGAGVHISNGSSPSILHNHITENLPQEIYLDGGGIYVGDSSPYIAHNTISHNTGFYNGSGIYIYGDSQPVIEHNSIHHNTTASGWGIAYGAGIMVSGADAQAVLRWNNIFENEVDVGWGGGVAVYSGAAATLERNVISNNYNGGLAVAYGSTAYSSHDDFVYNTGAGIAMMDGESLIVSQSILWGNSDDGVNITVEEEPGYLEISYSALQEWWDGPGNFVGDPLFNGPEDSDFSLQLESPCVDGGDPETEDDPDGTVADIGVHYFHQEPGEEPCPDLSLVDFGMCEMIIGWGWTGSDCDLLSGCGSIGFMDDDSLDYAAWLFPTQEECLTECGPQEPDPEELCIDLYGLDFGICTAIVGWAWTGEGCAQLSGCGPVSSDGIDYSNWFFDSELECSALCSEPPLELDCPELFDNDFFGPCDMVLGWVWNGEDCHGISGCGTIGIDGQDYAPYIYNTYYQCMALCPHLDPIPELCADLTDVDFGDCTYPLGFGWFEDECIMISGCDMIDMNGDFYGDFLYDTVEECNALCSNPPLVDNCPELHQGDFGDCFIDLGWAWTGEECLPIGGCGTTSIIDNIDYAAYIYHTEAQCMAICGGVLPSPVSFSFNNLDPATGNIEIWLETEAFIHSIQFTLSGVHISDIVAGGGTALFEVTWDDSGLVTMIPYLNGYWSPGTYHLITVTYDAVTDEDLCMVDPIILLYIGGILDHVGLPDCLPLGPLDPVHFTNILDGQLEEYLALEGVVVEELPVVSVLIESAVDLDIGDEISLMDATGIINFGDCSNVHGNIIVGAGVWQGGPLLIDAYGSMDFCPDGGVQYPGFVENNSVLVRVWDASEDLEYNTNLSWGTDGLLWQMEDFTVGNVNIIQPTELLGDLNFDENIDVLDVVILVGFILEDAEPTYNQMNQGDINMDAELNVLDVVLLVNLILGESRSDQGGGVGTPRLIQLEGSIQISSSAAVAGIQLTLRPGGNFNIQSELPLGWELAASGNRILCYRWTGASIIGQSTLFHYEGDLVVEGVMLAGVNGTELLSTLDVMPTQFSLNPPRPNPFNPVTELSFSLPEEAEVILAIYDLQGRRVATLAQDTYPEGHHSFTWQPEDLASGIYLVQLTANHFTARSKVVLVK